MRIVEEVLELLPEHIPEGLLASARDEAAKRFGPRAPAWSGSVTWKAFKHALRASLRTIGTSYAQETEMAISHAEFAHNRERVAALDNVFSKQLVVGQAEATLRLVGAGPDELKKGLLAAAIRFEQLKPHLSPFSRVGRTRGSLYEAPSHETAAKAAHWEGVTKPQLELILHDMLSAPSDILLRAALLEYQEMLRQVEGADSAVLKTARERMLELLKEKYRDATRVAAKVTEEKRRALAMRPRADKADGAKAAGELARAVSLRPSSRANSLSARLLSPTRSRRGSESLSATVSLGSSSRSRATDEAVLQAEHGTLAVTVTRAINVPAMDTSLFSKTAAGCDPFITLSMKGSPPQKTRVGVAAVPKAADATRSRVLDFIFPGESPLTWRGQLHELVLEPLVVQLKDKDRFSKSEVIGSGSFDVIKVVPHGEQPVDPPVRIEMQIESGADGKKGASAIRALGSSKCEVHMEVRWTPDKALSGGAKIRVGKTLVEVAPGSKMPGAPPASPYHAKPSKSNRECEFSWSWLMCGFDRKPQEPTEGMRIPKDDPYPELDATWQEAPPLTPLLPAPPLQEQTQLSEADELLPFDSNPATFAVTFEEKVLGMQLGVSPDVVGVEVRAFSQMEEGQMLPAERCGKIAIGDCITRVGGESTAGVPCDEVLRWVQGAARPVTIHFERRPARASSRISVRVQHELAPAAEAATEAKDVEDVEDEGTE